VPTVRVVPGEFTGRRGGKKAEGGRKGQRRNGGAKTRAVSEPEKNEQVPQVQVGIGEEWAVPEGGRRGVSDLEGNHGKGRERASEKSDSTEKKVPNDVGISVGKKGEISYQKNSENTEGNTTSDLKRHHLRRSRSVLKGKKKPEDTVTSRKASYRESYIRKNAAWRMSKPRQWKRRAWGKRKKGEFLSPKQKGRNGKYRKWSTCGRCARNLT